MTNLTTEKLAEIRKLAKAATPGPWFAQDVPGSYSYVAHHVVVDGETLRGEPDTEDDIAYIAAADPQTVLALLDEIDRLNNIILKDQESIYGDLAYTREAAPTARVDGGSRSRGLHRYRPVACLLLVAGVVFGLPAAIGGIFFAIEWAALTLGWIE